MRSPRAVRCTAPALFILLGCTCIGTNHLVRPSGDDAVVTFDNGVSYRAELLAVTQGNLYFLHGQRVRRCPLADLAGVHVQGYSLRTTKQTTLALAGVADAAIAVALVGLGVWPLAVLPVGLFAVGASTSLASEQRVDFRGPFADSSGARLALYCRYPRGLTDEQWCELMSFYSQNEFLGPDRPAE